MSMPQPQPEVPPFDAGNQLLSETPAQLSVAMTDTPAGQRMVLTVRTASTTLSVLLSREDARTWGELIRTAAGQMSGLIVAGGPVTPVNGHGPVTS